MWMQDTGLRRDNFTFIGPNAVISGYFTHNYIHYVKEMLKSQISVASIPTIHCRDHFVRQFNAHDHTTIRGLFQKLPLPSNLDIFAEKSVGRKKTCSGSGFTH